jgi:hypothetical protein
MSSVPSVPAILACLSNDKTLSLFKAIAISDNDCSNVLITKLKLTRKQFYLSIEKLIAAGLTRRNSGRYSLTSLGKVIFSMLAKIETAIKYYWKLKAIDSIIMSAGPGLPEQECQKIIDTLIDNPQIRDIIVTSNSNRVDCPQSLLLQHKTNKRIM